MSCAHIGLLSVDPIECAVCVPGERSGETKCHFETEKEKKPCSFQSSNDPPTLQSAPRKIHPHFHGTASYHIDVATD